MNAGSVLTRLFKLVVGWALLASGLVALPVQGQEESDFEAFTRTVSQSVADQQSSPSPPAPAPSNEAFPSRTSPDGTVRLDSSSPSGGKSDASMLPIAKAPLNTSDIEIQHTADQVNLVATEAELTTILRMIADHHGLNLVVAPEVEGSVTVHLKEAELHEVLDAVLGVAGFNWHRTGNLLYVTPAGAAVKPHVQGRLVQVYPLDYVAADDVESIATGLLSPAGNAFFSRADPGDQLRTRELLVVEDVPDAHARIAEMLSQINVPPQQVLVEAHVLQIALDDDQRHGVDLRLLARLDKTRVSLTGLNFVEGGNGPGVALEIDGNDVNGLLESIRESTCSRTLASPKISVVNHQEARIQIGERLPYSTSTTTDSTTVQSVQFLEVGVVLTVRPVITNDGRVLMSVLPKVSGGQVTPNGFPLEETTEVQTTVLVPDGGGVVIGGLIREENVDSAAESPLFGRIPLLGRLFRRESTDIRRNEVVVALVTHVMPQYCGPRAQEYCQLGKTLPEYAASETFSMLHEPSGELKLAPIEVAKPFKLPQAAADRNP
ncbi:MAG: hypothetical protein AAGA03_11960 [Planctomycetota bacterium]